MITGWMIFSRENSQSVIHGIQALLCTFNPVNSLFESWNLKLNLLYVCSDEFLSGLCWYWYILFGSITFTKDHYICCFTEGLRCVGGRIFAFSSSRSCCNCDSWWTVILFIEINRKQISGDYCFSICSSYSIAHSVCIMCLKHWLLLRRQTAGVHQTKKDTVCWRLGYS